MAKGFGSFIMKTVCLTIGTLATTTIVNRILEDKEKEELENYGFKVETKVGGVNVDIQGSEGPTLVLLSGYGTPAPILDFKPLARVLSRFCKVVTLEYLNYGCSDKTTRPRTVENIVEEIHETLKRLDIQEYWMVPHSISGVYTLAYVHRYPEEVKGVIGIDPSVPGQIDYVDSSKESEFTTPLKELGLLRVMNAMNPGMMLPNNDNYSEDDLKQMKIRFLSLEKNEGLLDEGRRIGDNFSDCRNVQYPKELPVLYFISSQTSEMTKGWWEDLHRQQVEGLTHGSLIKLEGKHYLHWTQSERMAEEIKNFFDSLNIN